MNVLVAFNGMETGQFALEEAARVAAQYGLAAERTGPDRKEGRLVVFSVAPPQTSAGAQPDVGRRAGADVDIAHRYLLERGIDAELKTAAGDPADEIVKEAAEGSYGMLILGSRDLGPIGRLVLGSVSREVAERSPCPVVIVTKKRIHRIRRES